MDTTVVQVRFSPSITQRIDCPNCALGEWAWSSFRTLAEASYFNDQIVHGSIVKRHHYVHSFGTALESLNVVNSGFLKSCLTARNGNVQITGFSMRGDMVGLDAISTGIHQSDSIALEDACLCSIKYSCLQKLMGDIPALRNLFHQKISAEIARSHEAMSLLGVMHADERIVQFLLNLSNRFAAIGCSKVRFRLPMQRQEIAEYLGLQLETISRGLSRLQEADAIAIDGKNIEIKNVRRIWEGVSQGPGEAIGLVHRARVRR